MRRGFLRKYDAGANHMVLCRMYVDESALVSVFWWACSLLRVLFLVSLTGVFLQVSYKEDIL